MTLNTTLGVGSAIQKPAAKPVVIPSRLVECDNGCGAVGQIWIKGLQIWAGQCPTCGLRPKEND